MSYISRLGHPSVIPQNEEAMPVHMQDPAHDGYKETYHLAIYLPLDICILALERGEHSALLCFGKTNRIS